MTPGIPGQDRKRLASLFTESDRKREFISGGTTRLQVQGMAAGIYTATTGDTTPICLATDRRELLAAALLAALAGGPPLLLPPSLSSRNLARLHQETKFSTALTEEDRLPTLPGRVRAIRAVIPGESLTLRSGPPDLERTILHIFTGGSTGRPKIWAKSAGNIFGEALYLACHFGITEQDCILATVPPLHIYGLLFSVLLPLVTGARVVAATPAFPGDITTTVRNHRVTVLAAVPAHYRVLRNADLHNASLRLAVSSAGPLAAEDSLNFYRNSNVGVVEIFGSTETGGIATRNRARNEERFTPLAPVAWQVCDNRLAVHSPFLSPDLPRTDDDFFITADRVAAQAGGFLPLGRSDNIAKVGGKRVDLEEIRELFNAAAGVEESVVLALPETGGRGEVIGVLLQGTPDMDTLKSMLADRLDPHARPKILKHTDRIPILANGKYDRPAILKLLQR